MENIILEQGKIFSLNITHLKNSVKLENPFQRVINDEKVKTIKEHLINEKNKYNISEVIQTGIIQIGSILENGNSIWYILDGQHRYQAYCELNSPKIIYAQLWKFNTMEDMRNKFIEINLNTPIENYVISNTINIKQKESYDYLIKYIQLNYKDYLKNSNNPQWPNINIDHFRKLIHIIPELKDSNIDTIINNFEIYNKKCYTEIYNNKKEQHILEKSLRLYINRHIKKLWLENASIL